MSGMPSTRPGIVVDCMVILQSALSGTGPAAEVMRICGSDRVQLWMSDATWDEAADVLFRPRIRANNRRLTDESAKHLQQAISRMANWYHSPPTVFRLPRDPKDEPYLNLAIAVGARYLVSRDKDLLELMTIETLEATEFRRQYPNLTVLDPATFLQALAG